MKITFTVLETTSGYNAYYKEHDRISVLTTGVNLPELKRNMLEAYNLYADHHQKKLIEIDDLRISFELG